MRTKYTHTVVSKIRTAPSPSIFSLSKDEELRQQVSWFNSYSVV